MNILQAMDDPAVLGSYFRNREYWRVWLVFLATLFALPMTPEQLHLSTVHRSRCTTNVLTTGNIAPKMIASSRRMPTVLPICSSVLLRPCGSPLRAQFALV